MQAAFKEWTLEFLKGGEGGLNCRVSRYRVLTLEVLKPEGGRGKG